jgi:branched-chain amino acid transport system permease protein
LLTNFVAVLKSQPQPHLRGGNGLVLQVILNGIFLGAIYVNIAVGFSLAWGVMDVINVAHGTMIVIGAFITFILFKTMGLDPFLSIPISMAVLFFLGYFVQKYLLNLVVKVGIFLSLVLTFGLDLLLINLVLLIFTGDYRSVTPSYSGTFFQLGDIIIPYVRLAILIICILLTAFLQLFMIKTRTGNAIRATSQNRQAAEMVGVNVAKIYSITLALSAALAGACGSLISTIQSFTPFEGGFFIMKAFIICVLGGLGNILGAIVGGLLLGIVETMGARLLGTGFQEAISAIIMILVLIFMPKGIVGSKYK